LNLAPLLPSEPHCGRSSAMSPWIGVGKVTLPALRTVRAVFPHTALQSVVSSSGMSRGAPGPIQVEQPGLREEGVGPEATSQSAQPEPVSLGLPEQQRTQSSADEPIKVHEGEHIGVLEVLEPASQGPIEIGDDALQTVAARPSRLASDLVLEAIQALLAYPTPPGFEPVTAELEPSSRSPAVATMVLGRPQTQPILRH